MRKEHSAIREMEHNESRIRPTSSRPSFPDRSGLSAVAVLSKRGATATACCCRAACSVPSATGASLKFCDKSPIYAAPRHSFSMRRASDACSHRGTSAPLNADECTQSEHTQHHTDHGRSYTSGCISSGWIPACTMQRGQERDGSAGGGGSGWHRTPASKCSS